MQFTKNIVLGLLASAAPGQLYAQEAAVNAPSVPPSAETPTPAEPRARTPVIQGPDGKPMSPEAFREFIKSLPEATRAKIMGPDGKPLSEEALDSLIGPSEAGRDDTPGETTAGKEIVVTAERPRGSVIGDIPPERVLNPLDIRAHGASNLEELLQSLAPETRSSRGRGDSSPVVLLNGKRVSSFAEIANIPPEAIERTEIFPEELSLKYGYRADQKVVNVVTFERHNSTIGQATYGAATAGGRDNYGATASYLHIRGDTRWNFTANYERADSLFESERNLIQAAPAAPYALSGNISPAGSAAGTEIDPALSALVGSPVTVAAVPSSAGSGPPSLQDYVTGANTAAWTDLGSYRTLLPATSRLSLNGTVARPIFGNVSATLNGRFEAVESDSSLGLASASLLLPANNPYSPFSSDVRLHRYLFPSDPLGRESSTRAAHIGTVLNGLAGAWLWSFTGNYARISNKTHTDRGLDISSLQSRLDAGDPGFNPFADATYPFRTRDEARSVNSLAQADIVMSGSPFAMPAGPVYTSLRGGLETRGFRSETLRGGLEQSSELSRDRAAVQANLDIPISNASEGVLPWLGRLSANLNAEVETLSDFGTLRTLGYGLNWSLIKRVSLIASVTDEDGAPNMQQLGNPAIVTPNARTFDFTRQETVDVTRIDGGNPDLLADNRHVFRLGLNASPFKKTDLSLSANYTKSRTENMIASLPAATPEIEAAFPDRFLRDSQGTLQRMDSRPVNFDSRDREQLRWGVNFSRQLGKGPPGMQDARIRFGSAPLSEEEIQRRYPGAVVQRFEAGSAAANRFEGLLSRLNLSLYHTWHLRDEITIKPGVPKLDLLNGSAIGNRGGQPEHEVELSAGAAQRGLGGRLAAKWLSETRVDGLPGLANSNGLSFSDYAKIDLRLFVDLGTRLGVKKYPWLNRTRLSVGIENLFDSRPTVRDEAGRTPINYQPDYIDPLGRTLNVSLRKSF